jgi:hypothetical protein
MLAIRTVEIWEVFMISVLIVLKLQLVDQGQMDGDFDSLLCVSEALSFLHLTVNCPSDYTISSKEPRASSFCSEDKRPG